MAQEFCVFCAESGVDCRWNWAEPPPGMLRNMKAMPTKPRGCWMCAIRGPRRAAACLVASDMPPISGPAL